MANDAFARAPLHVQAILWSLGDFRCSHESIFDAFLQQFLGLQSPQNVFGAFFRKVISLKNLKIHSIWEEISTMNSQNDNEGLKSAPFLFMSLYV